MNGEAIFGGLPPQTLSFAVAVEVSSLSWSAIAKASRGKVRSMVRLATGGAGQKSAICTRADRRLCHSEIFFPKAEILGAFAQSTYQSRRDAAITVFTTARKPLTARANLRCHHSCRFVRPLRCRQHLQDQPFICMRSQPPRGAVKSLGLRSRTGGLGTHFFTQNSGNIFF